MSKTERQQLADLIDEVAVTRGQPTRSAVGGHHPSPVGANWPEVVGVLMARVLRLERIIAKQYDDGFGRRGLAWGQTIEQLMQELDDE